MTPLVSGAQPMALWAVLLLTAAFSIWAGNTRYGRHLSGIAIAIFSAILLSNLNIIPRQHAVYDSIFSNLLPVAIPLLLFQAHLRRIIKETGTMLLAYAIGTVGIVVGVLVGIHLLPLGPDSPGLAGVFAATYIGGSMNFGAVAQASGFNNSSLLSTAIAADTLVTNFYIITIMALPSIAAVRRWVPSTLATRSRPQHGSGSALGSGQRPPLRISHISFALGLAVTIAASGYALEAWSGFASSAIVFITVLALVPANLFPHAMARLKGSSEVALFLIYLFLIAIGAGADVRAMFGAALPITLFALIVVVIHLLIVLVVGRWFKLDLAELIVASNANIGGSTTAGPIAAARGWNELVTPAILCGVLGNAVGTLIGVGLFHALS